MDPRTQGVGEDRQSATGHGRRHQRQTPRATQHRPQLTEVEVSF
jgi:hypothetical protein